MGQYDDSDGDVDTTDCEGVDKFANGGSGLYVWGHGSVGQKIGQGL